MTVRLELSWANRDLAWNPRDYGGIENIHVQPSLIWIPYITLLNSAKKIDKNILHPTRAVVRNTGDVKLTTPLTIESHCVMDIRHFPFDQHLCTLIFGSWTHDGTHVNVTSVLTKIYIEALEIKSNDFQLIDMNGRRSTYRHTCCREIYYVGLFDYQFQRRSALYQVGILLPSALICLLSAGIFWVPPMTGHRLKMGLILLLANLILLMTLGLSLPISATATPSIGKFDKT
uniref:Neurotransmitter-gated ion-channel ligand-binding domain-containing protein n=1 Tax=Strigamia maritima TaxID=126957 RepID=T1J216_STRMM